MATSRRRAPGYLVKIRAGDVFANTPRAAAGVLQLVAGVSSRPQHTRVNRLKKGS